MIDCLIVGDSIAVGTHHFKPECVAYAKGGINSNHWNKQNANRIQKNNENNLPVNINTTSILRYYFNRNTASYIYIYL